jgi:hypothetical protein
MRAWALRAPLRAIAGLHPESVIQDVDIPIAHAPEFLGFFLREIGILPVWICPIRPGPDADRFKLYPMSPGLHVNFGFWDVVRRRERHAAGTSTASSSARWRGSGASSPCTPRASTRATNSMRSTAGMRIGP